MSKLMWIAGLLLAAAGLALGVLVLVSPASVAGVTYDTASILLVGGVLAIGLGSVIDGVAARPLATVSVAPEEAAAPAAAIPEFRQAKPAAAVAAIAATAQPDLSEPTRETIQALEQARQKIEQAFGDKPPAAEAKAEAPPPPAAEAREEVAEEKAEVEEEDVEEAASEEEAEIEDGLLYVVEERVIRARPARILSDGTVEAETDEGWMRFENLEHLDEYLDAAEPAQG